MKQSASNISLDVFAKRTICLVQCGVGQCVYISYQKECFLEEPSLSGKYCY